MDWKMCPKGQFGGEVLIPDVECGLMCEEVRRGLCSFDRFVVSFRRQMVDVLGVCVLE